MTEKSKSKKFPAPFLLSISVLSLSVCTVFLLMRIGILPGINSRGIFERPLILSVLCAIICIVTGIPGILLHKKQNNYRMTPKKVIGIVLMSLSVAALTYSLYLILYYFDIIPNRNLGFLDISHVIAGIVAAPATLIGATGLWLFKSDRKKNK